MQVSKVVVQFDRSDIRHDRENCIRIVLVINWSGHVRTQYITWPICVRLKEPNNDENRAGHKKIEAMGKQHAVMEQTVLIPTLLDAVQQLYLNQAGLPENPFFFLASHLAAYQEQEGLWVK